jgi:hypothetical protein
MSGRTLPNWFYSEGNKENSKLKEKNKPKPLPKEKNQQSKISVKNPTKEVELKLGRG